MNTSENDLLIIQTSSSSSLFITKELFPNDADDIEEWTYCIREGDNPLYWQDRWHKDFNAAFNRIELPARNIAGRRSYISWWLNCRPSFIGHSVKPFLKKRVEEYHKTGEIKNAFKNAIYGLEFNSDCLFFWHEVLDIQIDSTLIGFIPDGERGWLPQTETINIQFNGFEHLVQTSTTLRMDAFSDFQSLLNHIYINVLSQEVPKRSYGSHWILYHIRNAQILEKGNSPEKNSLSEYDILDGDTIICYRK